MDTEPPTLSGSPIIPGHAGPTHRHRIEGGSLRLSSFTPLPVSSPPSPRVARTAKANQSPVSLHRTFKSRDFFSSASSSASQPPALAAPVPPAPPTQPRPPPLPPPGRRWIVRKVKRHRRRARRIWERFWLIWGLVAIGVQ
jgi:hypothetical protein